MISRILFLGFLLSLSACDESNPPATNFPLIQIKEFTPGSMEFGNAQNSFVSNSSVNQISVNIAWQPLTSTANLAGYEIYSVTDETVTLIAEIDDINRQQTFISTGISYETTTSFSMRLRSVRGERSDFANSNVVSVSMTYAAPDAIRLSNPGDSVLVFELDYLLAQNGGNNPLVNVQQIRNGMLDSISINLEYREDADSDYRKVLTLFGSYINMMDESGAQLNDRFMRADADALISSLNGGAIRLLTDYDLDLFPNGVGQTLTPAVGDYRFYSYLYRKQAGRMYVFRTNRSNELSVR